MDMRSVVWRLLIWIAEILDRNLLTAPGVDGEYYPPSAGPTDGQQDREAERTRSIVRDLISARAGRPPDFVQG
jgi:hypothetical protein